MNPLRNKCPKRTLVCFGSGKVHLVAYNDLIELARLCLRQAGVARTPAAASELRRMAKEYQIRADALIEAERPNIADATFAAAPSTPEAPSRAVQQQQQPQGGSGSADPQSPPDTPKRR
jgi:hypothetical protein